MTDRNRPGASALKRQRRPFGSLSSAFVVTLLVSTSAYAEPVPGEGTTLPAAPTPTFVNMAFDVGGFSSSNSSYGGGAAIGATVLVRRWLLEVGPTVNASIQFLSPTSRTDFGLLMGVGTQAVSIVGADLLLEGGIRHYSNLGGCSFLCDYSGVSGDAPYVGVRVGATLHGSHEAQTVFVGGLWFFVSRDLASRQVSFVPTGSDLFGPPPGETVTIGGATEFGLALRLGFDTRL